MAPFLGNSEPERDYDTSVAADRGVARPARPRLGCVNAALSFPSTPGEPMRLTAACLLGTALVAFPALSAPIPKQEKKTNAEKLLGKWELVKGGTETPKDVKFVVEFAKDGVMILHIEPKDGEKMTLKGKYKVDGEKIDYEMEQPRRREEAGNSDHQEADRRRADHRGPRRHQGGVQASQGEEGEGG